MKRMWTKSLVRMALAMAWLCFMTSPLFSQVSAEPASAPPEWQLAAGGMRKFDAATIRLDTSGQFKQPSFALSADDGWPPSNGFFHADFPLIVYIQFAYKLWLTPEETRPLFATLPKWVLSDTYEIRAQTQGNPTKDRVRLMMQSLLAERFGLEAHFETKQLSAFALTLARPGKLGPRLRVHAPSCDSSSPAKGSMAKDVFPPPCLDQSLMTIPEANHVRLSGTRNTTVALIATYLSSIGELDRPVVDRTGLLGRFDFSLEFTPDSSLSPDGTGADSDLPVTTFREALENQLGLILAPIKAPLDVLVVDHVERPAEK